MMFLFQLNGATIGNDYSGDTYCGGVLSNFILDPAIAPDAAGSTVPGAVIGEYFINFKI